jgi:endonuclease/exonuclease/phosphatase family metal-dependent hydrolase
MTNRLFCSIGKLLIAGGLLSIQVACATQAATPDQVNCKAQVQPDVITSPFLSVLTLNMAHGRKDSLNQMLQKSSATRQNLEDIAEFLDNSGVDLIALQEADHPSRWSGKFDHVEFVSQNSNYPCWVHAGHAKKYMYDFGTALLSTVSFTKSLTHTFAPSPPTTNKGFVMGEVLWNPGDQLPEPVSVSVISVHLDFSWKKVREAQVEEMRVVLQDITTPVIIMGDFNADWSKDASALKSVVANGNFRVYQPESNELGTYKSGKLRLDWILISNHLDFMSYEVPQMVLSDHQPVQATLKLVDFSDKDTDSN